MRRKLESELPLSDVMRFAGAMLMILWVGVAAAHPGSVDANGCHRDSRTQQQHCHIERADKVPNTRPPKEGDEGVFFGPAVEVIDGDSLRARIQGVVMEVRLAGIDAPEIAQPYGSRALTELRALVSGKPLVIVFHDVDRYGRIVGDVWIGDLHINRELVARGAAWFYPQFARNDSLFQVEQSSRVAQRGLWALPVKQRIEPWVWREQKRAAATPDSGSPGRAP